MPAPPVLAEVWRGPIRETSVRGHVAVVDASGSLVASLGDPSVTTTLRSSVKPLKAVSFVVTAADQLGVTPAELAVACASHSGEPDHLATIRVLLDRAGVSEDALVCGPHPPLDPEAARQLAASGHPPTRLHNNCSGEHAALLATCRVAGWPAEGYHRHDHPVQQAVALRLSDGFGLDLTATPWGVDGCGLPSYGVPLQALARAYATTAAHEPAFHRCQEAMAAHPHLVAGTGRFDTAVLTALGSRVTCKIGAAGVWAATLRPGGPALAIKLESGDMEAIAPVAIAVLQRLGMLPDELPPELQPFASPAVRNWAGDQVGATRVVAAALAAL